VSAIGQGHETPFGEAVAKTIEGFRTALAEGRVGVALLDRERSRGERLMLT
jgi:hypothetical protein